MANFKVRMANQKYSKNYLQNYTKMRQIPDKHCLFEVLRHMYLDGSIIKDHNLLNWLDYVKNKTDYKGITTEQAIELMNTYNNSPNNYVTDKNRYKIQHSIFGLVIDWWNLYYKNIGGVSCYYSDEGMFGVGNYYVSGGSGTYYANGEQGAGNYDSYVNGGSGSYYGSQEEMQSRVFAVGEGTYSSGSQGDWDMSLSGSSWYANGAT